MSSWRFASFATSRPRPPADPQKPASPHAHGTAANAAPSRLCDSGRDPYVAPCHRRSVCQKLAQAADARGRIRSASGTLTMAGDCVTRIGRRLIPAVGGGSTMRVPLPATGRGWAHLRSPWQRPAPGRRADGSIAGRPRMQSVAVPTQHGGCGDRPHCGLKAGWRVPGNGASPSQSVAAGDTKTPTRVPQGSPGTRAGSQGARRGSQGRP
jgi:hypothetical protein